MAKFRGQPAKKKRWLEMLHKGVSSNGTATAGDVMLALFEVTETVTVDQITILNGGTAAGNIVVGIYGPIVTEETCQGAPLLVESASTAMSGTSQPQSIAITATTLVPGRYYAALEFSNGTASYTKEVGTTQVSGWTQYYSRGGGFGALTNPCPAVTNQVSRAPVIKIRCQP